MLYLSWSHAVQKFAAKVVTKRWHDNDALLNQLNWEYLSMRKKNKNLFFATRF